MMIMPNIQSVTGFIGKNTDILEELGFSSPTNFSHIGFELYENIPAKRAIVLNGERIQILPEQTLEIEDITISSLTIEDEMCLSITYSF